MWHCFNVWVVLDVLKDRSAFYFRVKVETWRWRNYDPLKCQDPPTQLNSVISQRTEFVIQKISVRKFPLALLRWHNTYVGCLESIHPFWISQELVAWLWCNLAASQRRPYCPSLNSHSPVGLVSRQWDATDWACVLSDCRIHNDRASRSASSWQCACPFYSSCAGVSGKASHHPGLLAPLQPWFGSLRILAFPKAKIAPEKEEICEFDGHTVHKLSQWRLTADWLVPRKSDCSRTYSKVSSDR